MNTKIILIISNYSNGINYKTFQSLFYYGKLIKQIKYEKIKLNKNIINIINRYNKNLIYPFIEEFKFKYWCLMIVIDGIDRNGMLYVKGIKANRWIWQKNDNIIGIMGAIMN